jgi:hypothetical protein
MFGREEAPEVELKKLFWQELTDSPFVMLGLQDVEDSRTRPMTAQIDVPEDGDKDDGGPIYFFARATAPSRPMRPRATNCSPTSTARCTCRMIGP